MWRESLFRVWIRDSEIQRGVVVRSVADHRAPDFVFGNWKCDGRFGVGRVRGLGAYRVQYERSLSVTTASLSGMTTTSLLRHDDKGS